MKTKLILLVNEEFANASCMHGSRPPHETESARAVTESLRAIVQEILELSPNVTLKRLAQKHGLNQAMADFIEDCSDEAAMNKERGG